MIILVKKGSLHRKDMAAIPKSRNLIKELGKQTLSCCRWKKYKNCRTIFRTFEGLVSGHNMHFPKYLEEKNICIFSFYIKCIIVVQALYYLFLFNVKSGHTEQNLFSIARIV